MPFLASLKLPACPPACLTFMGYPVHIPEVWLGTAFMLGIRAWECRLMTLLSHEAFLPGNGTGSDFQNQCRRVHKLMACGAGGGHPMWARLHVPKVLAPPCALPCVPQRSCAAPALVHGWIAGQLCFAPVEAVLFFQWQFQWLA